MQIQLSDHFNFKKLFRFVLPTIIMMIFTSVYSVVDGFFVSNFVGKTPFSAINLIMPVPQMLGALGFMLGTGGSALVARHLGEQEKEKAQRTFSLITYTGIILGVVFGGVTIIFIRPIAVFLGAEGELLELCVIYASILLASLPFFMLQNMFQSFLVTAEKPHLGLAVTVIAGVSNMILDAVFVIVFKWGIVGAAVATALSQILGGVIPLIYFICKNSSTLRLVKPQMDGNALFKAITNGSSEFVTNISLSIVAMLYNFRLLKYAGENGVAAYGVIMYVSFIFVAIFLGYSIGVAPIIGYNHGSGNDLELKSIFKKSLIFVTLANILLTVISVSLSDELSKIFVGYDAELCEFTSHAFKVYSFSFLFTGFGIFGSAMFTALNDGAVSAAISFLRTLVFQSAAIIILPIFWELEGVWAAIIVAEALSAAVSFAFIIKYKKKYRY